MHRIDGAGATVDKKFTQGNPATAVPATTVTDAWLNAVQEELTGVIEATGTALDKTDNKQLVSAVSLHVGTIADLRALQVPQLAAGRSVHIFVRGYHADGDGGGGTFYWAGNSNEADNGGTVIVPNSAPPTGRWKRAWFGVLSARYFGGKGDGVTVDSAAVQNGANVAKAKGARYLLPAGQWLLSGVTVEDILVEGEGIGEQDAPVADGTVVLVTDTLNPAFIFKRGAGFRGMTFYYPNQVTSGAPIAYQPTLQGYDQDTVTEVWLQDVVMVNSYIAIRYGNAAKTAAHGRLSLTNCSIYGIYRSIEAYNLLDVIQLGDVRFTWGALDAIAPGQTLKHWTAANGECIYADRVDGLQASNVIVYGPRTAIKVAGGLSDLWCFSNFICDACLYGLVVDGVADMANMSFLGGNFNCFQYNDAAQAGSAVLVNSSGSVGTELIFCGTQFSMSRGNFIDIQGSTLASLIVSACQFGALGTATGAVGSKYAISVNDTDAAVTVSASEFRPGSYANSVGVSVTNAKSLNACGNTIDGANIPFNITAVSDVAMLSGNTTRGTSGASSVVLGAGARAKTRFGANAFDKAQIATVGSPKFVAQLSGAQTINSGVDTTVLFGSEIIDTTGSFDPATGVFTAPFDGVYRFRFRVTHDGSISTADRWQLKVKTTPRDCSFLYRAGVADIMTVSGDALVELLAGHTAKVTIARSAGAGNFVLQVDGSLSEFSGELVG